MSGETMKILQVYRSEPTEDVKKLVEILNRDRTAEGFRLYSGEPDYDILVQNTFANHRPVLSW